NNNGEGIWLYLSKKNNISKNIGKNNKRSGILLDGSDINTLSGNTANNNKESGIYLYYSENNTLSGNIANNNYFGINLADSDFNNITENTLFDNNICYSEDEASKENTFKYNICVKEEPSDDDWIISGVIGILIASIILIGLSVLYWQFKRKVK
ncbi:hypothetical protein LCGC14_2210970, partial [marine sediment metagenome]